MLSKGVLMLDERNAMSWVVKSVGVESFDIGYEWRQALQ